MLEALIARWGYAAIGLGTFFEGEAVLVAGGALAHQGQLQLPLVILVAFVGSVLGDQLWFQLGRRLGQPLLERRPTLKARAEAVHQRIERYGDLFVLGFRFVYGIRTVTPALLGMSRYSFLRFTCLNLIGGAVWSLLVGCAGWALGAALGVALKRAAHVEELLGVAIAAVILLWLLWRLTQRSKRSSPNKEP